jgi:sorting nexin-1/2
MNTNDSSPSTSTTTTTAMNNHTLINSNSNSNNNAFIVPPPPLSSNSSEKRGLEISVSDPVKQGEGLNAFVSYKIHTKVWGDAARAQFDFDQFTVVRRFSDFVWLREQLEIQFPGIIIPPLPEKMMLGRFSDEYVDYRRRALEKFLRRIAAHSMLRESGYFKTFLEDEVCARVTGTGAPGGNNVGESAFDMFRQTAGGAIGAPTAGFWEWVSESSQNLTNAITGSSRVTLRERTPEDDRFEEAKRYIEGFEPHIQNVHKNAAELAGRCRDSAKGLFEFGLAFTLLGQAEQGVLGNALCQLGHCADRLSVLSAEQAEKEQLFFVEPTKDYTRLVAAAKHALNVRTQKKNAYEAALGEVVAKRAAKARLTNQPITSARDTERIAMADQEIARAEAKAEGAKEEFDLVTRRVLIEIERFKREKLQDFRSMIMDFVTAQIEHNQRVEDAWRSVLPELQHVGLNSGGMSSHGNNNNNVGGDDDFVATATAAATTTTTNNTTTNNPNTVPTNNNNNNSNSSTTTSKRKQGKSNKNNTTTNNNTSSVPVPTTILPPPSQQQTQGLDHHDMDGINTSGEEINNTTGRGSTL